MRLPANLEKNAISVFLVLMGLLMVAAALCRHLWPQWLDVPLSAAGGCLTWIASLGMARAAALGLHVRMAFVENFVSERSRRRLAIVADTAFLVFAAFTFAIGCAVLLASRENPEASRSLLVYLALPLGSLLTMARLIVRLRIAFGDDRS